MEPDQLPSGWDQGCRSDFQGYKQALSTVASSAFEAWSIYGSNAFSNRVGFSMEMGKVFVRGLGPVKSLCLSGACMRVMGMAAVTFLA